MKKIILLLGVLILMVSCGTKYEGYERTVKSGDAEFNVIKIDGCDYLFRHYDRGCMFTHKGNCSNPIHYPQVKDSTEIY